MKIEIEIQQRNTPARAYNLDARGRTQKYLDDTAKEIEDLNYAIRVLGTRLKDAVKQENMLLHIMDLRAKE